jgi:hypothetical protein
MKILSIFSFSILFAGINAQCPRVDRSTKICEGVKGHVTPNVIPDDAAVANTAPKFDDFLDFFESKYAQNNTCEMLLFWSGMVASEKGDTPWPNSRCAPTFAARNGRFTLEMLLGNRWEKFQKPNYPGYLDATHKDENWGALIREFFVPASRAFACFATGNIAAFSTEARWTKKDEKFSGSVWWNTEKPVVIESMKTGRIKELFRWKYNDLGNVKDKDGVVDVLNPPITVSNYASLLMKRGLPHESPKNEASKRNFDGLAVDPAPKDGRLNAECGKA